MHHTIFIFSNFFSCLPEFGYFLFQHLIPFSTYIIVLSINSCNSRAEVCSFFTLSSLILLLNLAILVCAISLSCLFEPAYLIPFPTFNYNTYLSPVRLGSWRRGGSGLWADSRSSLGYGLRSPKERRKRKEASSCHQFILH